MPTIVSGFRLPSMLPNSMVWPIGSWFGQRWRAKASLITATCGEFASSCIAEDSSAEERNAQGAEVALARDAIIGMAGIEGSCAMRPKSSKLAGGFCPLRIRKSPSARLSPAATGSAPATPALSAPGIARTRANSSSVRWICRAISAWLRPPIQRNGKRKFHGHQVLLAKTRTRRNQPQKAAAQ